MPGSPYAAGGSSPVPQTSGRYIIRTGQPQQTIWGLGFEVRTRSARRVSRRVVALTPHSAMTQIQSDSIGSGNNGMPGNGRLVPDNDNTTSSAPHDLTPSERVRFATELLQGFRFCRLALGLFLRGLDAEGQHIVGRWPSQMAELKQMQDIAGFEGDGPGGLLDAWAAIAGGGLPVSW
jgi:hypothetical protein